MDPYRAGWLVIPVYIWGAWENHRSVDADGSQYGPDEVQPGDPQECPENIAGFNPWEGLRFLPIESSAIVVVGYTVILLVLSVMIFYRQDLSG